VSPVKYVLGFYIPEDDILHSHRRENLKSYMFKIKSYGTSVYHCCLMDSELRITRDKFKNEAQAC
jgi:hypothetical protein